MKQFGVDLPIASILFNPRKEWAKIAYGNRRLASHTIDVDWKKFNINEYLLTHASIVCSVDVASNGFYIEPPCDELVNSNGNAWTTPVLIATFKSFIGGANFVEHVQLEACSKGRILDAVLRPVKYVGKNGATANILYVDILVGTERKHAELVEDIETGKMSCLSMGCVAQTCVCSKCGKEVSDSDSNCIHLDRELGTYFIDPEGKRRTVAELCGRTYRNSEGRLVGDPDSCKFIEASWVENPAFKGAVVNYFVSEVDDEKLKIAAMNDRKLQMTMEDLFRLRVADRKGMSILRIAREEMLARRREKIAGKIVRTLT